MNLRLANKQIGENRITQRSDTTAKSMMCTEQTWDVPFVLLPHPNPLLSRLCAIAMPSVLSTESTEELPNHVYSDPSGPRAELIDVNSVLSHIWKVKGDMALTESHEGNG
jgi:hypothetical protein